MPSVSESLPEARRHSAPAELAVAALLSLAATLVVFQMLVRHPGDVLAGSHREGRNDVTTGYAAFRELPGATLDRFGRLATWNPYGLAGMPWWGEPQSALFYPPNWLYLMLPPLTAMGWVSVAHHWWAGVGAMLLGRKYGFGWPAAAVTGVAFLGAPYLLAQTAEGHYNQICLIAWVPWGLLTYERFRRGERGGIPLTALVLALAFFCGHAQEVFFLTLILSAFVAVDVLKSLRRPREAGRLIGGWCVVGAATVALVAVDLLPVWAASRQTVRSGGMDAEAAGEISLGAANLWQLLAPFVLGDAETYSGPGKFFWETLGHFGLVASLLAIVGAVTLPHRYPVGRMIGLLIGAYAFAFGPDLPLYGLLHEHVPGVSLFRSPSRALFFCSMAVAVLAGQGTDRLTAWVRGESPRGRRLAWGLAGGSLLAVACTVNSVVLADAMLATIPAGNVRWENPVVEQFEPGLNRALASQELLGDREAWRHGIHKVQAYQPVPLSRTGLFHGALVHPHDPAMPMTGFDLLSPADYDDELLDLLGVSFWIVAEGTPFDREGWREVARGTMPEEYALRGHEPKRLAYRVYENESPLPRAFVLGSVRWVEEPDRLTVALRQIDPRQEVLVENDVLPPNAERASFTPAEIVEYTPDRVRVRVDAPAAGYLVLTDTFFSGWRATIDGSPAPVVPAYVAFRAVPVAKGSHDVVLSFHPPLSGIGLAVSGVAWAVILLACAASVVAGRRGTDEESLAETETETESAPQAEAPQRPQP